MPSGAGEISRENGHIAELASRGLPAAPVKAKACTSSTLDLLLNPVSFIYPALLYTAFPYTPPNNQEY